MKRRKRWLPLLLALATALAVLGMSRVRLGTGRYYAEQPVVRWKFAIYYGECDDETGCHFSKMDDTGPLEYFGLRPIPHLDPESAGPASSDTRATPPPTRPDTLPPRPLRPAATAAR